MAQSTDGPGQDRYSQLNEIARGRPSEEFFDEETVSEEEFETICRDIVDDVEHIVEDFVEGTVYTRRQAQVRVLRDKMAFPTQLTANAIGVLIGWWENKDSPIGQANIAKMANQAEEKSEDAYQTAYVETANRRLREYLEHEYPVWIDQQTRQKLNERRDQGESLDETIQGLLLETQSVRSLRNVLEEVIENYPVADMQASRDVMLSGGTRDDPGSLILNVSVPGGEMGEHNPGDAVDSGTVFRFGDDYIKPSIVPAAAPGGMLNSVQIYASDNITGMDPVTLDEGLENLETALKEEAGE